VTRRSAGAVVMATTVWLAGAVGVPGAPQSQVQPVPLFRTGVNLVTVDVSVLDKDRRPVRGLTADDFTILENGLPQPVAAFTAIDLPDVDVPSVAWLRNIQPDTQRNDDQAGGRLVILVLDDSTPMPAVDTLWVRKIARQVVEKLGPDDLAAVVYTLDKKRGQDFTRDRARLMSAVEVFIGGMTGAQGTASGQIAERPFSSFDPSALTMYQSTVSTLRALAEDLAELPQRRKALIFISVGVPLDLGVMTGRVTLGDGDDSSGQTSHLVQEMLETFAAAQRANVNIYSLDPGGLRTAGSTLNHDFLKAVSANTGGFAITDTNDVEPALTRVFRENGSYYLLGYQVPDPKAGGRFRRIEVQVNRPGVTVRTRTGYFEPRPPNKSAGARPSPLTAAISGIVPRVEVPMQVTAAPFAVAGKRAAAVAVAIGIRAPVPSGSERAVDNVDVQVSAYDPGGSRRGAERLKGRVVLRPVAGGVAAYEVISRVDLNPGRYQLRVAATSSLSGKSGSVFYDIDVPDFTKDGVSMSGVVLSVDPRVPTAPKDGLPDLLPIVPTTIREFSARDRVTAFLRVYQGGNEPLVPVRLALRIVDSRGATAFNDTLSFGPDRFSANRTADWRIDVPISLLEPGPHLLTIEATPGDSRDATKPAPRREIPFTVR